MKKHLMFLIFFAALATVLPAKASAQYNTYNGGAFLNYALASRKAAAIRAKGRYHKKHAGKYHGHRRRAHRKSRRVSMFENTIAPKIYNLDAPRRTYTI